MQFSKVPSLISGTVLGLEEFDSVFLSLLFLSYILTPRNDEPGSNSLAGTTGDSTSSGGRSLL